MSRACILEPNEFESESSSGTLLNCFVSVLKQSGLRGREERSGAVCDVDPGVVLMLVKCKVGTILQSVSGDDPFVSKDRAVRRQVSSLYKPSAR